MEKDEMRKKNAKKITKSNEKEGEMEKKWKIRLKKSHHLLPVIKESPEKTGIQVIQDSDEQILRELECMRELLHDLAHAIHKLQEDW